MRLGITGVGDEVEYRVYSDDEYEELRRPRPATLDEFEALLEQLWQNVVSEQERLKRLDEPKRTARLTASVDALAKLSGRMTKRWRASGTVVPWDASMQTYRSACASALIDLYRRQQRDAKRIAPGDDIGTEDERMSTSTDPLIARAKRWPVRQSRWERLDDQGLEAVDPYQPEDVRLARATPTLLAAVAVRTLRVLGGRERRPRLSDVEATTARFLQEMEYSMLALTADDLARAARFAEPAQWRSELAHSLGISVTAVYKATEKILGFVRLGWYLFIILAPKDDAVVNTDEMGRLLDRAHYPCKEDLDATQCMLLRKAGAALVGTPSMRVDVGTFISHAQGELKRVASLPGDAVVDLLHTAEITYARDVPGQTEPPAFQCVLACDSHHHDREAH